MKKKIKLALIFGGKSNEYKISLRSVNFVIENVDRDRFELVLIGITSEGDWYLYTGPEEKIISDEWFKSGRVKPVFLSASPSMKGIIINSSEQTHIFMNIDVIFPVLHGYGGEDGRIQGLFDLSEIPYVGCDLSASHLCMDKEYAHILLEDAGIKMTDWILAKEADLKDFSAVEKRVEEKLSYPVFVKPANSGSSVGVSRVNDKTELLQAVHLALAEDKKVIIEKAVVGREVECAVFGNGEELIASPIGEVESSGFYDYDSKYENDSATVSIPANLPEDLSQKLRETAKKAYICLGCDGLARVDFFVADDGELILNEINTLPGFTSISMYPKLMEKAGLGGKELVTGLIELALDKKKDD